MGVMAAYGKCHQTKKLYSWRPMENVTRPRQITLAWQTIFVKL
ncbi:hypothetical protein BVRB_4g073930 [Beta vulgaris subsp. vulgaris]|nr:hypothetical protein BVRB_4g073930 [Beta vulgaris subsp. vulgaris]